MKNLKYYMNLPYRIEIQPIPETKGGGYEASIPQLGKSAVCADGDSVEEVLKNLGEVKEERLTAYLEEGLPIAEPEPDEDDYSGKFILRIPKYLHRELALRAKENNVSLNHFISSLLAGELQVDKSESTIRDMRKNIQLLRRDLSVLKYNVEVHVTKPLACFGIEDEEDRAA